MKIIDILKIENNNKNSIFLIKEGIFWRSYEYSAWRFIMNIKDYQVLKKYVKTVKQDIVYLGFPDSILEQILKSVETIHVSSHDSSNHDSSLNVIKNEKLIEIKGFKDAEGFEQWKAGIKLSNVACYVAAASQPNVSTPVGFNHIIEKISFLISPVRLIPTGITTVYSNVSNIKAISTVGVSCLLLFNRG